MIELERHIEILLLNNDCVIVPELGGFMAHHVEARYDTADNVFLPPLRTLGFNPQLTINDSLLAQSYVEAYDISYPEAVRRISGEVEELKHHLSEEGVYELNDIGVIRINEEGNYEFSPCEAGILSPSLYALTSFAMPRRDEVTAVRQDLAAVPSQAKDKSKENAVKSSRLLTEPAALAKNNEDNNTNNIEDNTVVDENVIYDDDDDSTVKIRWSAIRNTVAIAAAVICFFLFTSPLGTTDNIRQARASISEYIYNNVFRGESNVPKVKSVGMTKPAEKATMHKEPVAKQAESTTAALAAETAGERIVTSYSLVLASHVARHNAEDFVKRLQKSGYTETRLYHAKGQSLKVVYGSFDNEKQAYNAIHRLHGEKDFAEAWVMKIKEKK